MSRRVALIHNTSFYVGPPLAMILAERGHDLVIGDPQEGLVDQLEQLGASVEVVEGVERMSDPDNIAKLVDAGLRRFGRIDAATAFTGRVVTGSFETSSVDDLDSAYAGCLQEPFHFLKAVVPVMANQRDGQVLLLTSATGARPTKNAPLYSAVRAGANMLVRNVAAEYASRNVQVNALGTNFMDFPEFRRASGADDPDVRARIEAGVPMRRLGTVDECAALCAAFLDGSSRFTTGQFVGFAGGWV